jgi:hypothetical protein
VFLRSYTHPHPRSLRQNSTAGSPTIMGVGTFNLDRFCFDWLAGMH